MSKMTNQVKENRKSGTISNAVENYMGGISYVVSPLHTLKMVTASSVFGEPQYYRDGEFAQKGVKDGVFHANDIFEPYMLPYLRGLAKDDMKTSDLMEQVIDNALMDNYKETLEWAVTLRNEYMMRLNPQIIMVRACMSHMEDKRKEFSKEYPSLFRNLNLQVMKRADDVIMQATYYLYKNGSKSNIPNLLKRSWAEKINGLSRYEIYKYRNHGIGLIDVIRICHAGGNKKIDELMHTGTVAVPDESKTWESLRADGMKWEEIYSTLGRLPHMALLRNLRGMFTEIEDYEKMQMILSDLKGGVASGKQFPFRYMSARNEILKSNVHHKVCITDALEECMDISIQNMPHLKGNNAFLSDNSGSAWGQLNSEYGTVTVAEIGNLSSVIGACLSDEGTVFKFGDNLKAFPISKKTGILHQAEEISAPRNSDVGGATENGIWLFFKDAIENCIHYDNIFIYSDMQAGHGGLYGTEKAFAEYKKYGYNVKCSKYIDVAKLIEEYRRKVNSAVNVFCIQTAGYNNVLVPENGYRTSILYGWTGKEFIYADMMDKCWENVESQHLYSKCI